jgi:hypothetical protein
MDWSQVLTIIASLGIPTLSGLGWIIHKIGLVDQRLSKLEGAFEERRKW